MCIRDRDIAREAAAILRCIKANHINYGVTVIIDIVRGAGNQKILSRGLDRNPEYGSLKEVTVPRLRQIIQELLFRGYLELSNDNYPVLKAADAAEQLQQEKVPLLMKLAKEREPERSAGRGKVRRKKAGAAASLEEKDLELFETLRALRKEIAAEEKVPPYMVFSDKTLALMSAAKPENSSEILMISGVGEYKMEKYGARFLEAIARRYK